MKYNTEERNRQKGQYSLKEGHCKHLSILKYKEHISQSTSNLMQEIHSTSHYHS